MQYLRQDDHTLITPDPEECGRLLEEVRVGRAQNRDYLAAHPQSALGGRLTGTFIYAHPPDYIGRPTLDWRTDDWRALFRWLRDMGMDTVIYQAAAWREIRECYYPSRCLAEFRNWNNLDPLTEAVALEGFTLFLGGLGNLMGFDQGAGEAAFTEDRDLQLECLRELEILYQGGFHGFYMSPETGFPGRRDPAREKMLNAYYQEVCRGAKEIIGGLPILFSPATYYREDSAADIQAFLTALFQDCAVDILCPQDSIGVFGNRLSDLPASFDIWRSVCAGLKVELWVNVESFERFRAGTAQDFEAADFPRLAAQISNAGRFGRKIVSWEVPYFYSPLAGKRGEALRRAYLKSLEAGERLE
jgi:hypothetical protein